MTQTVEFESRNYLKTKVWTTGALDDAEAGERTPENPN
jgi:hypothetical protein